MSNDLANIPKNTELAPRPDYIGRDSGSLTKISKYVTLPRVITLQNMSPAKLLEEFGESAVIVNVNERPVLIAGPIRTNDKGKREPFGPPIKFNPIFFFEEYITWNDRKAISAGAPRILDTSFDPNSQVAKKALNPEMRQQPHPKDPNWKVNHVQHLNFVGFLPDIAELAGTPVVISFCKGEHRTGRKFCALAATSGTDLFSRNYEFCVEQHYSANSQYKWWGFAIANHADCWVRPEVFEANKKHSNQISELFKAKGITTEYEYEELDTEDPNLEKVTAF